MSSRTQTATAPLRADAQRNVETIRRAALDVFRERGLGTALDEVARSAGVSKGTIYHRFGGRTGLIDAVVEELVGERIEAILAEVGALAAPGERFEGYLRRMWRLQFEEPAANDVLLRSQPDSAALASLCARASAFGSDLLAAAQADGFTRADITPEDLYLLIWERGIIARACASQSYAEFERRFEFVLAGLRSSGH
ncbi:TetR/AcrR family transcriptional regulator [Leucobacter sp. BZR 635]